MRKKLRGLKRIICLVLVTSMALAFAEPASETVYAGTSLSSITSDSIKEKEAQIQESETLKKQLQSDLTDAKAIKKELENLKADVTAYIETIDSNLADVQDKIEELKTLIDEKQAEIDETTLELEEAVATEEAQYEAMKKRIKFIYERGDSLYMEIMLSASSFSDFLTKADYVDMLEAYDRKLMDEYTEAREWTELCKATLEAEKEALDEAESAQEEEEAALEELLAEKEIELSNYNRDIANKTAQINTYQEEYDAEVAVIEQLEAQILQEKKDIASKMSTIIYDGGQFAWPCPNYTRITDEFGYRTDPITGATSYHSGLDMGAPAGSAILAAYDGVVVAATYNWSMGNYVMIDHGDGLYTIYMHASKLYVSANDVVVKGETIAAVGTTGRSTGNHLHFSVRLNGTYVSPWNYLK